MKRKLICALLVLCTLCSVPASGTWLCEAADGDWTTTQNVSTVEASQAAAGSDCELLTADPNTVEWPDWGITLTAENVTPTGMTLVTTHSGGNFSGELMYESAYHVEAFIRDHWEFAPIINDICFSGETFRVVLEGSEREELNWEHGYGELPPGRYRIVRRFWDYRGDGDFDEAELYVELPHTCVSEDGDVYCDQCYGVPEHECWNGNGDLRCDFCDELVDTNINMLEDPAWGITLSAENVTPTGMTLVTTHSGGNFTGELMYESAYDLEVFVRDHWEDVPIINDIIWSGETFRVVLKGSEQEELNWEHGYGELPPGRYRIVRRFWDYRGDGDYDEAELYTYFVIADASVEEHYCDSFNNDFICDWCYAVIPHSCYAPDGCNYCEFCYQYIPEEERMGFWSGLFYGAEDGNTLFQLKKPGQAEASVWSLSWKGNNGYSLYDILGDYQLEISKSGHVIRTEDVTLSKSCDGVDYDLYPLGDVTGDFVSNISDVAKIYSYTCETGAPTDAYNAKCSDVNGDGKINVGDVAKLYGYTRGNSRIYYSYCVEVPQQWEACFIRGWDDRGNTTYYPLTQAEDGSWYGMLESWYTDFAICDINGQTTVDLKCPKADSRLTLVPMNDEASLCDAVITIEGN